MIFKSLSLKNFMNISSCDLQFRNGINVLSGSIGSGKSAILDAISFCLLDTKRGSSWSEYVKRGEKSFEIDLIVEVEPNEDMVFNFKGKASSGSCEKMITYKEQSYFNSDCTSLLQSVFDLEMYQNIVFNMQGSTNLSSMTPSIIRDVFKKIFNSDFTNIVEKIKADQSSLQVESITIEAQITALKNKTYHFFRVLDVEDFDLPSLKKELAESQLSEIDKHKYTLYSEKLKETSVKQSESNYILSEKEKYTVIKKTQEDNLIKVKIDVDAVTEKLNASKKIKEDFTSKFSLATQNKDAQTLIYENIKIKYNTLKSETDAKINILTSDKINTRTDISILTKHIEAHKKGLCESCGQTCDVTKIVEFEGKLNSLNKTLDGINLSIFNLQSSLDSSILVVNEASIISDTANKAVSDLTYQVQMIELDIKKYEQQIESFNKQISQLESDTLPQYSKYIDDCNIKLFALNKSIDELESWCKSNKFELSDESKSKRSSEIIQKEIDGIQQQISANIEQGKVNQKLSAEKADDQNTILVYNEKMNDIQITIKNMNLIKSIWESDFPSFISIKACTLLESYMNSFFASVKPDLRIKIVSEKKGISILYSADGSDNFGNLKLTSGGEGSLTTLGFKVAVAHAFGSELLLLDEPDHANDPESGMKLLEVINNIPNFKQMVIISHKPSALEFFKEEGANIYSVNKGVFEKVD